uniref:Uncharacterized protein n=1 Tax=Chaetoceros debilis TaxID=122233 RepID=A0A6S8TVQ0_9STRA
MYNNFLNPLVPKKSSYLRFQPPGFNYPVDIPFPGRVLPVCARCKKNYKTREHCRSKEGHTGLPWTDTYICITFDASCFTQDGSLCEGPFMANGLTAQPYVYESTKILPQKTPSCAMCKDKNYTRTYCRASKKHKTLPWSTVYVMLSLRDVNGSGTTMQEGAKKRRKLNDANSENAVKSETFLGLVGTGDKDSADASTENDKQKEGDEGKEEKSKGSEDGGDGKAAVKAETASKDTEKSEVKEKEAPADIFDKIHSSRTFLSTVSVDKNIAEWVDLDQNQANYLSHRQKLEVAPPATDVSSESTYQQNPYTGMMAPGNMGTMGMSMNNFPANYGHNFPGATMGGAGGPVKDDQNRSNPMDRSPMENPWLGGGPGMPYSDMMSMMDPRQMVDPRMGGYGFQHPSWGRGYPNPMDMGQMHSPYGAAQTNPYGYPPMGPSGHYPGDMGGMSQTLGQGMVPQGMPQGMQQQPNMPPQSFPQNNMGQGHPMHNNMTQGMPAQPSATDASDDASGKIQTSNPDSHSPVKLDDDKLGCKDVMKKDVDDEAAV